MTTRERIQKVLAARGVGSRRQVEAWIEAGRITVNGQTAVAGQAIGPRDEVRLDGRKLRLRWGEDRETAGLVYHRPAREGLREAVEGTARSSLDRLPAAPGGRWIPVNQMGLGEGGLELFVNDGAVAGELMRAADRLSCEYSVRVRGDFDESRVEEVLAAAARDRESSGTIEELAYAGGEGANRWARVVVRGLRPRDLKRIFEHAGIEANRILRVRLGPLVLDRALARGRARKLREGELAALLDAAGMGGRRSAKSPGKAATKPVGRRGKPAGRAAPTGSIRRRTPRR